MDVTKHTTDLPMDLDIGFGSHQHLEIHEQQIDETRYVRTNKGRQKPLNLRIELARWFFSLLRWDAEFLSQWTHKKFVG